MGGVGGLQVVQGGELGGGAIGSYALLLQEDAGLGASDEMARAIWSPFLPPTSRSAPLVPRRFLRFAIYLSLRLVYQSPPPLVV